MGKVVVLNHVSLDGVMQALGRADEDSRGGFALCGWARSRGDSVGGALGGIGEAGAGAPDGAAGAGGDGALGGAADSPFRRGVWTGTGRHTPRSRAG